MPLISPEYKALNTQLHRENTAYGTSGRNYSDMVEAVCRILKTRSVLDYGCGKGTLAARLPFSIANYDPCIPGLDSPPSPATVVVCTEVLEHIEPENLDAVLDDLARLTLRLVVLTVALGPAEKTLADGRNAHLIVRTEEWWNERIEKRFRLCSRFGTPTGFCFMGQSLNDTADSPDLSGVSPPAETTVIKTKSVYNDEQRCKNIRSSMLRGLTSVPVLPVHNKTMILACYGPSLESTIDRLRRDDGDVYTVSGAHKLLISRGILPMGHIEADPRPHKAKCFGLPNQGVCYFLASACDRAMFDALQGFEKWLFHVTSSNPETELIASMDRNQFTLDGGTNVGMTAIALGTVLGYRKFSIYGMDCSFEGPSELLNWPRDKPFDEGMKAGARYHAGPHPNEDQDLYRVWVGDRPFLSSPQMFQAAQDYIAMVNSNGRFCRFELHGDGFLKNFVEYINYHKKQRLTG